MHKKELTLGDKKILNDARALILEGVQASAYAVAVIKLMTAQTKLNQLLTDLFAREL